MCHCAGHVVVGWCVMLCVCECVCAFVWCACVHVHVCGCGYMGLAVRVCCGSVCACMLTDAYVCET